MRNLHRRRWLYSALLSVGALLAACDGETTAPAYTLDLAEIKLDAPVGAFAVPDSAYVGEPFRIAAFAWNRGCESPGGLSVTETAGRLRIVGAVRVEQYPRTSGCVDVGGWPQAISATPTVEGPLTVVLIGRVRDRTDSLSRVVRVLPRRAPLGSFARATTLGLPRSGAQ